MLEDRGGEEWEKEGGKRRGGREKEGRNSALESREREETLAG